MVVGRTWLARRIASPSTTSAVSASVRAAGTKGALKQPSQIKKGKYFSTLSLRHAETTLPTASTSSSGSSSSSSSRRPPSFLRRHWGKLTFVTLIGVAVYEGYQYQNPPEQLPFDPSKKTVAVIGSGWGATSVLQHIDTEHLNVIMVSPRNHFLFTPLLPSCTVGTIENRSIMQPIRTLARFKKRAVHFVEAHCTSIDVKQNTITVTDNSEIQGDTTTSQIKYDYLVMAPGAENATFGIQGVNEHACYLKEISDAKKIRSRLMDCLESAAFPNQSESEKDRLLHMVVVGGGPTGVEYAGELRDFLIQDLSKWYPEIADRVRITLIEALPNVLNSFSRKLIEYTEQVFAENKVDILNNTAVKEVKQKELIVKKKDGTLATIPYGLLVWAAGNAPRQITRDLIAQLPAELQKQRRGVTVDDHLLAQGASNVFVLGDASATKYAPTAQVASQQGKYVASLLGEIGLQSAAGRTWQPETAPGFNYAHWGSLAYIGQDKAIADLPGSVKIGGVLTFVFWRSVYASSLLSWKNRTLVVTDWAKTHIWGRDTGRE